MIAGLPYMPLKEQWLTESPCFLSGDARLVRACVAMLIKAWRNEPAASLAPNLASLAAVTGLTEKEVADNFEALTTGWELREERLFHIEMEVLVERLLAKHGETLIDIAERTIVATQNPDDFQLLPSSDAESKAKGKRALRPEWRPSRDTVKTLAAMGISEQCDVDYIVAVMRDWHQSTGEKRVNWDSTLLNFARKEPQKNFPSNKATSVVAGMVPGGTRFSGLVSKGVEATSHNVNMFTRVRQGQGG
jgi:hypothetical protein